MTPEEYQWHINLVKDRYHALNPTFEQAEQIYKFEQDKGSYSDKHYFSTWEEWDYELTTFRQILNGDQLTSYEKFLQKSIKQYEQDLIEQDKEKSNELAYHKDLINFCETRFLPDFFNNPFLGFGWLHSERAKIDYLKSEYKRFLNESKKAILTSHFRHYRTFKPNELKASLLHHELSYHLPDYHSFKHEMDEPTKAVATHLESKLGYLPDEIEALVTGKFEQLRAFNEANSKKHFGEPKGWHVVIGQMTPDEEKKHRIMTILLLDRNKYAC